MQITEGDQSLVELRLVPAIVFNFEWDPDVQDPNLDDNVYLKPETLMLLQEKVWGKVQHQESSIHLAFHTTHPVRSPPILMRWPKFTL